MQLTRFIQELLYQHECVTIPQFGAFLTRPMRVRITSEGMFYPPRKEVNFNQLLVANDGVLAHYFAQKEGVSYEHALRQIEKEVSSWKKRLQTQTLRFPGVGELRLNAEKKIQFIPWGKVNFDLHTFGLVPFKRTLLEKEAVEPKLIPLMENPPKDDLMFTPEKEKSVSDKPWLRYAAIGAIGVALLSATYYFGDQYLTDQRLETQVNAQQQIEKKVQEATFDLGSFSTVEVSIKADPKPEKGVLAQPMYSVIAGSFRSVENAEKKRAQLVSEGYEAALAEINPEGLYRVAYGRFKTKKEAISLLYFLKYTLEEEAWYLEEK